MIKNKFFLLPIFSVIVASCAQYQPIIDTNGVDMVKYQQDKAECEAYASQVQDNTLRNALIGGAVGAALGAVTGDNSNAVGTASAIGGLAGAGTGKAKQLSEREQVLTNCLYGRGYNILNAGGQFRYRPVDRNINSNVF